jgi:UDP-N-acetylmuramoylalanine-D-glutamate ligase
MRTVSHEGLPRVPIVGGGFGGVAAAKVLRNTNCRVTLIDQRNYYLFQPFLRRLAGRRRSPISAGCGSPVLSPGGSGGVDHILFLSGMRNRVVVALEWFWAYLAYHPSTRLITGEFPITIRSTIAPSADDFPSQRVIGG